MNDVEREKWIFTILGPYGGGVGKDGWLHIHNWRKFVDELSSVLTHAQLLAAASMELHDKVKRDYSMLEDNK